jgi:sorting nexin-1/2
MFGSAKIKMSSNNEETHPSDFKRRKAHLKRFLNRIGKHPSLMIDPDFRDFLEISDGLPKATNTSALSGANVMKFF